MPELKVVKPSDTRWLSHERCIKTIVKELPALITTLHQLYETSGDAEAYGVALVLSSFSGIACLIFLSKVLDLLAKLNCFMQRQAADFSRLPLMIDSIQKELKLLIQDGACWCSEVTSTVLKLEEDYGIIVNRGARTRYDSLYLNFRPLLLSLIIIETLITNMDRRFSDAAIKLLVY